MKLGPGCLKKIPIKIIDLNSAGVIFVTRPQTCLNFGYWSIFFYKSCCAVNAKIFSQTCNQDFVLVRLDFRMANVPKYQFYWT